MRLVSSKWSWVWVWVPVGAGCGAGSGLGGVIHVVVMNGGNSEGVSGVYVAELALVFSGRFSICHQYMWQVVIHGGAGALHLVKMGRLSMCGHMCSWQCCIQTWMG